MLCVPCTYSFKAARIACTIDTELRNTVHYVVALKMND